MFDQASVLDPQIALRSQAITGSVTGEVIPIKGAAALTFAIFAGALTTADSGNLETFKLVGSQASDLSSPVDIPAADMIVNGVPGGALPAINLLTQANKRIGVIAYRGHGYAYVGLVGTPTGSFSGTAFGVVIRGLLSVDPVGALP